MNLGKTYVGIHLFYKVGSWNEKWFLFHCITLWKRRNREKEERRHKDGPIAAVSIETILVNSSIQWKWREAAAVTLVNSAPMIRLRFSLPLSLSISSFSHTSSISAFSIIPFICITLSLSHFFLPFSLLFISSLSYFSF